MHLCSRLSLLVQLRSMTWASYGSWASVTSQRGGTPTQGATMEGAFPKCQTITARRRERLDGQHCIGHCMSQSTRLCDAERVMSAIAKFVFRLLGKGEGRDKIGGRCR